MVSARCKPPSEAGGESEFETNKSELFYVIQRIPAVHIERHRPVLAITGSVGFVREQKFEPDDSYHRSLAGRRFALGRIIDLYQQIDPSFTHPGLAVFRE